MMEKSWLSKENLEESWGIRRCLAEAEGVLTKQGE